MKIASAILAGFVIATFAYRILFCDFSDFIQGLTTCLRKRRGWRSKSWTEEDPDSAWSGLRFFFFLLISLGGGFLVYCELHQHFG